MSDLINRADAIEAVCRTRCGDKAKGCPAHSCLVIEEFDSIPSAEADGEDLIIKGAKGIQDGLYNIKDGKLFKYKAKGGTVRTYPIVPSADAEPKRVLQGCCKGANTIKTIRHEELTQIANTRKAVESADAVQGEWQPSMIPNEKYVCSVCGGASWYYDYRGDVAKSNFCPNCGARMKGGDDE